MHLDFMQIKKMWSLMKELRRQPLDRKEKIKNTENSTEGKTEKKTKRIKKS